MRTNKIPVVLTIINLGILLLVVTRIQPVQANNELPVLRGRGLEIVDAQGKVRASIQVVPPGPVRRSDGSLTEKNGKVYPEAVLFRLIRPDGRPSVKIETSEQGAAAPIPVTLF
jgi:hypothetical protein